MKKNLVIQLFDKNYEFLKKLKKKACVLLQQWYIQKGLYDSTMLFVPIP